MATLVQFTAAWCGPCKATKPVLTALVADRPDLTWHAVDIDEHPDIAASFGVMSVPTFVLLRGRLDADELADHGDDDPLARHEGALPKPRLAALLDTKETP